MLTIKCASCGHENKFDQPYPVHAGFSNQGFLYNDEGNLTLIWSSFDPAYEAVVGRKHPWTLTNDEQALIENALRPAPVGGRWRFANPARCTNCTGTISNPIIQTIHYLVYPGSINADLNPAARGLKEFLSPMRF